MNEPDAPRWPRRITAPAIISDDPEDAAASRPAAATRRARARRPSPATSSAGAEHGERRQPECEEQHGRRERDERDREPASLPRCRRARARSRGGSRRRPRARAARRRAARASRRRRASRDPATHPGDDAVVARCVRRAAPAIWLIVGADDVDPAGADLGVERRAAPLPGLDAGVLGRRRGGARTWTSPTFAWALTVTAVPAGR